MVYTDGKLLSKAWTKTSYKFPRSSSDPLFPFCRITARLCISHRRLTFCTELSSSKWDSWWAEVLYYCTICKFYSNIEVLSHSSPKLHFSKKFSNIMGDQKFHLFLPVKGYRLVISGFFHFLIFLRINSYWDFLFLRSCLISF